MIRKDDIAKKLIARCYKTDEEINIIDFEELFNDEIIDNIYLNKLIDDLNMQQEVRMCGLLKDSIFICLHKFDDTGGIIE